MPQLRMLISVGRERHGRPADLRVLPKHRPVSQKSDSKLRIRLQRSWPSTWEIDLHQQAFRDSTWSMITRF